MEGVTTKLEVGAPRDEENKVVDPKKLDDTHKAVLGVIHGWLNQPALQPARHLLAQVLLGDPCQDPSPAKEAIEVEWAGSGIPLNPFKISSPDDTVAKVIEYIKKINNIASCRVFLNSCKGRELRGDEKISSIKKEDPLAKIVFVPVKSYKVKCEELDETQRVKIQLEEGELSFDYGNCVNEYFFPTCLALESLEYQPNSCEKKSSLTSGKYFVNLLSANGEAIEFEVHHLNFKAFSINGSDPENKNNEEFADKIKEVITFDSDPNDDDIRTETINYKYELPCTLNDKQCIIAFTIQRIKQEYCTDSGSHFNSFAYEYYEDDGLMIVEPDGETIDIEGLLSFSYPNAAQDSIELSWNE